MTTTRKSTTKPKPTEVGINVLLPAALHRQLRVKAVTKGQTLTQAITEAARAWVQKK